MPRRTILLVLLLAATMTLAACQGSARTSDRSLQFVDAAEGARLVQGRSRLLGIGDPLTGAWVDPRTDREFIAGHIPGAVHLPFQNVSTDHRRLRAYDVLVVYGNDYNDAKAEGMSKRLLELGFSDVYTLRGGLRAWAENGHTLDTGPATTN